MVNIMDLEDCSCDALKEAEERAVYWEKQAKLYSDSSDYYQKELVTAHALLGRIVHQYSERWDSVNLTKYFPTDNLWGKKTVNNPSGK